MNDHEICSGCKNEIDPTTCHCGDDEKSHGGSGEYHYFCPQGCCCGYYKTTRCQFCEKLRPSEEWKNDTCPCCGRKYDAMLAQEGDD